MGLVKIDLENGKYTALHHEEHGGVTVLRYGEPWRNETGDKFILAMIQHIQKLEEDLNELQEINQSLVDLNDASPDIVKNLEEESFVIEDIIFYYLNRFPNLRSKWGSKPYSDKDHKSSVMLRELLNEIDRERNILEKEIEDMY